MLKRKPYQVSLAGLVEGHRLRYRDVGKEVELAIMAAYIESLILTSLKGENQIVELRET